MPILENVTTKASRQVWASPDGQRKIFEVIISYDGNEGKVKTYSEAIAKEGFSGSVETYEKQGKQGTETFAKQPPKPGGGYAGRSGKPQDQFTMYLSYAKDIMVAMLETGGYDAKKYQEYLEAVSEGGKKLYGSRAGTEDAQPEPSKEDLNTILADSEQVTLDDDPFAGMDVV